MTKKYCPKIGILEGFEYNIHDLYDFYIDWCELNTIQDEKRMKLDGTFQSFLIKDGFKGTPLTHDLELWFFSYGDWD